MIACGFLTKQLGKCIGCISHPCTLFLTWSSLYRHSYCKSEMHQPNNFEIYCTSPECCNTHFSSSSTCLQDSNDLHARFPFPEHPRQRPYSPEDATSDTVPRQAIMWVGYPTWSINWTVSGGEIMRIWWQWRAVKHTTCSLIQCFVANYGKIHTQLDIFVTTLTFVSILI